jgi:hypothetical protein
MEADRRLGSYRRALLEMGPTTANDIQIERGGVLKKKEADSDVYNRSGGQARVRQRGLKLHSRSVAEVSRAEQSRVEPPAKFGRRRNREAWRSRWQ